MTYIFKDKRSKKLASKIKIKMEFYSMTLNIEN